MRHVVSTVKPLLKKRENTLLEFIATHWIKIYALVSIGFYLLVWAIKKTYASKENVEGLNRRLTQLEGEIKQLPDKDDMHKLELTITTVNGKMDGLSQQMEKLQRTTEMLLENELQGENR